MKRLLCLVLLLCIICSCASLGAEEPPEEKKIKWADIEELPEDYIEWDVPFAQMEEYDLTKDTVPKLANPHPMCIAPQEYDSYDGGKRKLPRQYKRTDKTCWEDSNGYDYVINPFDVLGKNWNAPQLETLDTTDAPIPAPAPGVDYANRFDNQKVRDALSDFENDLKNRPVSRYLGQGHYVVFTQNDNDWYGVKKVQDAFDVRITKNGELSARALQFLGGYEFLAVFNVQLHDQTGLGTMLFLKNGSLIVYHDIDNYKSVEFAPEWRLGEGIWAPAKFYSGGNEFVPNALYPILPIEERNFGFKRGELLPPTPYNPVTEQTDDYPRHQWYDKNEIKPEQKKSRIFLFNVESGKIIHDFEDIHRFYAVSPDNFIIPHTAQNGEWMITGLNRKGVTYNLPFSCFISKGIRRIRRKKGNYLCFFSQSHYALLDMLENKLYRHTYTKPVDETNFKDSLPYPYRTHLFISESYEENGVAFRNVWRYDWNFKLRYHFRIRDVFGSSATNCLILEGHTYFLLYDGHKFLKIRTRELPIL